MSERNPHLPRGWRTKPDAYLVELAQDIMLYPAAADTDQALDEIDHEIDRREYESRHHPTTYP